MENIINDGVLKTIQLKEEIIYKVSMSKSSIPDEEYNEFRNKKIIVVNRETKAKGTSTESQGESFSSKMKIGDYFFLCRGNEKLEIIGKITGDAENCNFGDKTYLQRTYDIVIDAIKEGSYAGENKWWAPKNNSTCIAIKDNDIDKANKELFIPFFKVQFLPKNNTLIVGNIFNSMNTLNTPLNQILFGPPGTGKTYNTVNKAITIANPEFILKDKITGINTPRNQVKAEFDKLVASGQIVFTTFHQSMSYEDFIEGIKPKTIDDKITYQVEDGIFKKICQDALTPNISGFNAAYEQLIKELSEIEAADSDATEVKTIEIKTPTGKPFSISLNSNDNLSLHTGQNRSVQGTLTKENIQKVINNEHVFKGYDSYFKGVIQYLTDHYSYSNEIENTKKNFVLIIDEINRGNVSQIFGELITLIEDDKRLGCDEALEVTLPYSKKPFGVPSNLYIIGTMNTADRSVEALDAALRRRFSFEEMPPDSNLIKDKGKLKDGLLKLADDEINLPNLLKVINLRIEKLLDKDHQIGHSYFINVEKLDELKLAFQNKIIPLLQEYFFGDNGKIGLVLGRGFVEKVPNKSSFTDFPDADANEFSERPIFTIKPPTSNNEFVVAIKSLLNQVHDDE